MDRKLGQNAKGFGGGPSSGSGCLRGHGTSQSRLCALVLVGVGTTLVGCTLSPVLEMLSPCVDHRPQRQTRGPRGPEAAPATEASCLPSPLGVSVGAGERCPPSEAASALCFGP